MRHRIWPHAIALAVVLAALIPILSNGYPAIVDEAVYSYQAANLADGSWESHRPIPNIDVDGIYNPLIDAHISGDQWIPYARQPLYPLLLTPFFKAAGYAGLLIFSAIGTWGAAVTAGLIARRIDRRATLPSLWLAGLGTPLLFDAFVAVGHSIAAALSGSCALAVLTAMGLRSGAGGQRIGRLIWPSTICAIVSGIMLVLVRSEGALVVAGLSTIGCITSISVRDHRPRLSWQMAICPVLVGLTGATAYFVNSLWLKAIIGVPGSTGASVDRATDPLAQAWNSLIRPWGIDTRAASTWMALATTCTLLGALALRTFPRRPLLGTSLIFAAALAAVLRHLESVDQVSGLIATVPIVIVGLMLIGHELLGLAASRMLLGTSLVATLGTLWLAYGMGGATEWGGRFYHVLIPLLVPVAVASLWDWSDRVAAPFPGAVAGALIVMTISISLLSLRFLVVRREHSQALVKGTQTVLEGAPNGSVILVAPVNPSGLSRVYWSSIREGIPLLNGGNLARSVRLFDKIESAEGHHAVIITDTDPISAQYVIDKVLARAGSDSTWKITDAIPVDDTGYIALRVTSSPS